MTFNKQVSEFASGEGSRDLAGGVADDSTLEKRHINPKFFPANEVL